MVDRVTQPKTIAEAVLIDVLTLDDLSNVRYVHAAGFRQIVGPYFSDAEVDQFQKHVLSPAYTDRLEATVRDGRLFGARLGGELVGSAHWSSRSSGAGARMEALFVRPLFNGIGIGTRMINHLEATAATAGYKEFSLRCPLNAVEFFLSRGYRITSQGVYTPVGMVPLPIVFMRKTFADDAAIPLDDTADFDEPNSAA